MGSKSIPQTKISIWHGFFNEIEKNAEPSWGHLEAIVSQLGTISGHLAAVSRWPRSDLLKHLKPPRILRL